MALTAEDWHKRYWEDNNLYFHCEEPHDMLVKFYDRICGERNERIFLPLCGKSVDLMWLANRGHEVVGLEFSDIAVKAVFEESNQEYNVLTQDNFDVYKAKNVPLTIYKGDFFLITNKLLGKFDAVWDRGGFTAIEAERRSEYVKILLTLLQETGKVLLFSVNFDTSSYGGPPYPASIENVKDYFGNCKVEEIDQEVTPRSQWDVDDFFRSIYLISK